MHPRARGSRSACQRRRDRLPDDSCLASADSRIAEPSGLETGAMGAQSYGMAYTSSLAGRILIAMPGIDDPRFERAVILVCAHNDEHAMGIAVNRPVEGLTIPSLLTKLGVEANIDIPDDEVLFGGPVERERGFVLHTDDYAVPQSTITVASGIG